MSLHFLFTMLLLYTYYPPAKKMRGIDAGFAGRNEPQIRVP